MEKAKTGSGTPGKGLIAFRLQIQPVVSRQMRRSERGFDMADWAKAGEVKWSDSQPEQQERGSIRMREYREFCPGCL